jgi:hypothetical protein
MSRTSWIRGALLGVAVSGSLMFGASQALAKPASACDRPEQVAVSCTRTLTSCDGPCASIGLYDGGLCSNGTCCTCKY